MKNWDIVNAKYITSAVREEQYPVALTQVAFIGRSNVGKSSLINSLCRHNGLARVSGTPGKTQTINFYEIDGKCLEEDSDLRLKFHFVDLPGYGFAKTSKKDKEVWGGFIGKYLEKARGIVTVCQLIDIRHEPMPIDLECYNWLKDCGRRVLVVLTKADKLSKNQVASQVALFKRELHLEERDVVAYSSLDNKQRGFLIDRLMEDVLPC
ncbi:MAG: ribosome biogenesis GTP-binding protein YihA/YsxC [Phascolarctobacterium sp.]|nr:ribosome biogenesis GTP-binding protein YihA/YsxC [Phascolarctobacterium sp.]